MLYGLTASVTLATSILGAAISPDASGPGRAVTAWPADADSSEVQQVTIIATDFAFEAPDSIRAGLVTLHLINRGKALHHAWLVRLEGGKTLQDFLQSRSFEPWMVHVGGPAAAPGAEATATLLLAPGSYGIVCLIPDINARTHAVLGMARALKVVGPAPSAGTALPPADDSVRLTNYAFLFSRPLMAGHHRLLFRNDSDQPHEAVFVRLAPGKTPMDFVEWSEKPMGSPPGTMVGGITGLSPGREAEAELDLDAGRYALICFVPDATDGKPHFMHGMITELTVH